MNYEIAAIPTTYRGVRFRSRLEARWATFFDLAGWQWRYEPIDLNGWIPDFWVSFPCGHSECPSTHELYIEVKPYRTLAGFAGHAVTKIDRCSEPSPAMFGWHPDVTGWEMAHGAGSGIYSVTGWVEDADKLWSEAGNRMQWQPPARQEP
jgi:hypothetical protein